MGGFEFNLEGMEEFKRRLDEEKRRIERLSKPHKASTDDLFPEAFMKRYTEVDSFDALLEQLSQPVEPFDDLEDSAEWNDLVREKTKFASWSEMGQRAVDEYMARRLGES